MRILFAINQLFGGGAESVLVDFLSLLPQSRFEVFLVVYDQKRRKGISLVETLPKHVKCIVGNSTVLSAEILAFVSQVEFEWAISVGEWHSPGLVMEHARAKRKAIWLHADVTHAEIPCAEDLFDYDDSVDRWICVSNAQRDILRRVMPFLADRCVAIHNAVNRPRVRRLAAASVELPAAEGGGRYVVMVGNLRPAKNYVRAVQAAAKLRNRGVDAIWLVIGSLDDGEYVRKVRGEILKAGMADRFILLGAQANPWKYMARADVLVSSSDTESWCMVVSEALALGKPVVSTATDGVSEQICDGENGFLCDFNADALADGIVRALTMNLCRKAGDKRDLPSYDPVAEFDRMVDSEVMARPRRETLFVIDDVNYCGGAHLAAARMIGALALIGIGVDVYSGVKPQKEVWRVFAPARIFWPKSGPVAGLSEIGFKDCIFDGSYTLAQKWWKFKLSLSRRFHLAPPPAGNNLEKLRQLAGRYSTICVLSEGSIYRDFVAGLEGVRRIQFVHTFYSLWRDFSEWTHRATANDGKLYAKMDRICLIGTRNAEAFGRMYPELSGKVFSFRNLIPVKAPAVGRKVWQTERVRFLSIARMEEEKDIPRMVRLASRLKASRLSFEWRVIGDGKLLERARQMADATGNCIDFVGYDDQPQDWLADADAMVLLSHYEGLPNVIYESMVQHVPVIATAVGGIPEQIEDGVNGCLVADDEEAIYAKMREVLLHPELLRQWKAALADYTYDNDAVRDEFAKLIMEWND